MRRLLRSFGICLVAFAFVACSQDTGGDDGGGGVDAGGDAKPSMGKDDTGTSGSADTVAPDGDEQDTSSPPDTSQPSGDTGPAPDTPTACTTDSDADGLPDCEEERLCTDPNNGDTDGDHLSDFEELQKHQSDPCSKDSDGDGVEDDKEVEFGLDPNRARTYQDGPVDGDLWYVNACKNPSAEPVDFYTSQTGNWKIALPPAFSNYTNLRISGASGPEASAVFDDTANEVGGFLLSMYAPQNQTSPEDVLKNKIPSSVQSVATVKQSFVSGEFTTHDRKRAAAVEYEVVTNNKKSIRRLRDELLFELAPFSRQDASGLPSSTGSPEDHFRVEISVIYRKNSSGKGQNLLTVAVAPFDKFRKVDKVRFRLDDLTNTTNVAESVDDHLVRCELHTPKNGVPKAEFYWVIDQSGSMYREHSIVQNFANKFENKVKNTSLDYRLGVTNMVTQNKGHLAPSLWMTSGSKFSNAIQKYTSRNCSSTGAWRCNGSVESGLEVGMAGVRYMKGLAGNNPTPAERARSNAEIVTIFMSDEAAQGNHAGAKQFFKKHTTSFALTAHQSQGSCGPGRPAPAGDYKQVALGSGGAFADLCRGDLRKTLEKIIIKATGASSRFVLDRTPISSSLRVYLNGTWVPRSQDNGFDYFAERNSLSFFGKYRPQYNKKGDKSPDYISVSFETFKDRCKENGNGAQNCPNMLNTR